MPRRVRTLIVISLLLLHVPLAEAAGDQTSSGTKRGWSAKRITWTCIGAGLGFGAGAMFGLNRFDDAINSDRKVWISAIVGAAAGGVAGGLLSRSVKPAVPLRQVTPDGSRVHPTFVAAALGDAPDRTALLPRVRAANAQFRAGSSAGGGR